MATLRVPVTRGMASDAAALLAGVDSAAADAATTHAYTARGESMPRALAEAIFCRLPLQSNLRRAWAARLEVTLEPSEGSGVTLDSRGGACGGGRMSASCGSGKLDDLIASTSTILAALRTAKGKHQQLSQGVIEKLSLKSRPSKAAEPAAPLLSPDSCPCEFLWCECLVFAARSRKMSYEKKMLRLRYRRQQQATLAAHNNIAVVQPTSTPGDSSREPSSDTGQVNENLVLLTALAAGDDGAAPAVIEEVDKQEKDYEAQRIENILRNHRCLISLGLAEMGSAPPLLRPRIESVSEPIVECERGHDMQDANQHAKVEERLLKARRLRDQARTRKKWFEKLVRYEPPGSPGNLLTLHAFLSP